MFGMLRYVYDSTQKAVSKVNTGYAFETLGGFTFDLSSYHIRF